MPCLYWERLIGAAILAIIWTSASSLGRAAVPQPQNVNRGIVELEIGRGDTSIRIAEDLASIVDDGATRRVLPVIGQGALQNITDLQLLHGIDLTVVQTDALDYVNQNIYSGLDSDITYIARLFNNEFHLLAGPAIKNVTDLAGKKVNIDLQGSSTAITAARIFDLLKIPIIPTYNTPEAALEVLRHGNIAALAVVTGKPESIFQNLISEDGFHFVPIPPESRLMAVYPHARLTALDYPGLIPYNRPVDTVAVGTVLVAANLQPLSDRYRNVVNFVDAFFTEFPTLLQPGHDPKWHEVNIAAELSGWRRFPPAAAWLQRNAPAAAGPSEEQLKAMFARFLDERQRATGGQPFTQQQKDNLFGQFEHWQKSQSQ
jgi:uncharacterized protein